MEGYYLIIDGIKSYFSIRSEVYIDFLKKYIYNDSNITTIHKEEFILLLEQNIDSILNSIDFGENNLNSYRIKKIEYKNNLITLNLRNDVELLVYNLVNIYNQVLQSQEINIQLICKNE